MEENIHYPSASLLSTEVAYHVGGSDKTGHALVIFPTINQQILRDLPENDLTELLQYLFRILPLNQRLNGVSYLINLVKSPPEIIRNLTAALNLLQHENNKTVYCLYVLKPKTSKNFELLQKLTGHKVSKKNPVQKTYLLKEFKDHSSLHRCIDKHALPEEYGGNLVLNISTWVNFRIELDGLRQCIDRCKELIDESRDQLQILCDVELPSNQIERDNLIEKINTKYNRIMSELNLEHAIDRCAEVLDELNSSTKSVSVTKFAQGDLLRETVKFIRTNQRELTESREQLQKLYRQSQARIIQSTQIRDHHKSANKICKWVERTGATKLTELEGEIISHDSLIDKCKSLEQLTASYQELRREADLILADVEFMVIQESDEVQSSFKAFDRLNSDLKSLELRITKLSTIFTTATTIYNNVNKCYNWYSNVLEALPPDHEQFKAHWYAHMTQFSCTAPPGEWLNYIKDNIICISEPNYSNTVLLLIKRIEKFLSCLSGDDSLDYVQYRIYLKQLQHGLSGVSEVQLPAETDANRRSVGQKEGHRPKSRTPKLQPQTAELTSTDSELRQVDVRSQRRSYVRSKSHSRIDSTPRKESQEKEVYVNLSTMSVQAELPASLSHLDLTKFMENEPQVPQLSSTTSEQVSRTESPAKKSRSSKKRKSSRRQLMRGDNSEESDDSCPHTARIESTFSLPTNPDIQIISETCPTNQYTVQQQTTPQCILQENTTPSNRQGQEETTPSSELDTSSPFYESHKKLNTIFKRVSPTLSEKLDLMAAVLESADDGCFRPRRILKSHVDNVSLSARRRTPTEDFQSTREKTKSLSDLTSSNLKKQISTSVNSVDHIYHWLNKQSEPPENPHEDSFEEVDTQKSVEESIRRAEQILQQDIPTFSPTQGGRPRRSGDVSGDSGITELTSRDLRSHGRCVSKESGLDSDMGAGRAASSSESHVGRRVPPLQLRTNRRLGSTDRRLEVKLSRPTSLSKQHENF